MKLAHSPAMYPGHRSIAGRPPPLLVITILLFQLGKNAWLLGWWLPAVTVIGLALSAEHYSIIQRGSVLLTQYTKGMDQDYSIQKAGHSISYLNLHDEN